MREEFIDLVGQCAALVRKRDLRKLGESPLVHEMHAVLQKRLAHPLKDYSPVLIGDTLLEVFKNTVEAMRPTDVGADTPQKRYWTYLREYILGGREWDAVAETLGVARSTFYDIQKMALDSLAAAFWRLEEEAEMPRQILHNLERPPYLKFVERYTSDGKSYRDDIVISELREGRPWIITIKGDPGTGKSSLAYAVVEKYVQEVDRLSLPFEAVICIRCRPQEFEGGKDPIRLYSVPTSMSMILDIIGSTLGKREVLGCAFEQKQEIVNKLLREHTCLFFLDNLDSEWLPEPFAREIEEFIQKLPPPHKALVTMRQDQYLRGELPIKLDEMGDTELQELIVQEARGLYPLTQDEFRQVYKKTQGNPLAVKQAMSLIRLFGYSLDEVLDFEQYGSVMLDFMYEKAYDRLSIEAKKVLSVLPLFIDSAPEEALEYTSEITGPEKVRALGWLYRGQMVEKAHDEVTHEQRYTLLPFAREYLRRVRRDPSARVGDIPIAQFLEKAYSRWAEYYTIVLEQSRERSDSLLLLLKTDKQNIFSLMEWCWNNDKQRLICILEVIGIPLGTLRYLEHRRLWGNRVVEACQELGRREDADWFLIRDVAWALARMGTRESRAEAKKILEKAKQRAIEKQWSRNLALALRNLGRLVADDGDFETAQAHFEQSLSLWDPAKDAFWRTTTVHAITELKRKQKNFDEAEKAYLDLEREFMRIGDINGQIEVKAGLSIVAVQRGDCKEARRLSDISIERAESIPFPASTCGYTYVRRSEVEEDCGALDQAIVWAKKAERVFEALGMSYNVDVVQKRIQMLEQKLTEGKSL